MLNEVYFSHAGQRYVWKRGPGTGLFFVINAPGLHAQLTAGAVTPAIFDAAVKAITEKLGPMPVDPDRRPGED